jgi:cytochrome c oxidase subunit IV
MAKLLRDRLLNIWALLMAVTLLSALIGEASGAARIGNAALVTAVVLVIAFAKAGLVMHTFMDLRRAPLWLRTLACVWLICALGVLLAVYSGAMG